jgi:Spy/CpxP family protein refolding chaperone
MKHHYMRFAGAALLASGMLLAQSPAPSAPSQPPAHSRQWHRGQFLEKIAEKLNLTDDQKQHARSILEATRQSAEPVAQQLRQQRLALREAVKAGKSDAEIDQLSSNAGALMGQLTALHTKGFSKIYAILTPDQRAKAQQLGEQFHAMFMNRWHHGNGGGSGSD